MFEKISKKKMKRLMLWKYIFQFLIVPLIISVIVIVGSGIIRALLFGFSEMVEMLLSDKYRLFIIAGGEVPLIVIFLVYFYLIDFANILSIGPFIKLIVDCICKDDEKTKEIEISAVKPASELQGGKRSKRFACDIFSKKENLELLLYDGKREKYRFFWNENYGEKIEESKIHQAKRMRISYFKHSKIIFRCEILESEQY